jgi:hypothetical protein
VIAISRVRLLRSQAAAMAVSNFCSSHYFKAESNRENKMSLGLLWAVVIVSASILVSLEN